MDGGLGVGEERKRLVGIFNHGGHGEHGVEEEEVGADFLLIWAFRLRTAKEVMENPVFNLVWKNLNVFFTNYCSPCPPWLIIRFAWQCGVAGGGDAFGAEGDHVLGEGFDFAG